VTLGYKLFHSQPYMAIDNLPHVIIKCVY